MILCVCVWCAYVCGVSVCVLCVCVCVCVWCACVVFACLRLQRYKPECLSPVASALSKPTPPPPPSPLYTEMILLAEIQI